MAKVYGPQPHIRNWMPTHVEAAHSEDTGGGCAVDVLKLKDGRVLIIADDAIALYASMAHWQESGECPEPCIDRHMTFDVPMERRFLCVWSEPTYEAEIREEHGGFFTKQMGYSPADIAAIGALEVNQTWLDPESNAHIVRRIA